MMLEIMRRVEADLAGLGRELGLEEDRARRAGKAEIGSAVCLVVDCSGSMAERDKISQARAGGTAFARDAFSKGFEVGVVCFSTEARHACEPTRDQERIARVLGCLAPDGGTNLAKGLSLAFSRLEGVRGRKAVVVVTDGQAQDKAEAARIAAEARRKGISILAVGTDDADHEFLASIVTDSSLAQRVPDGRLSEGIRRAAGLLPG